MVWKRAAKRAAPCKKDGEHESTERAAHRAILQKSYLVRIGTGHSLRCGTGSGKAERLLSEGAKALRRRLYRKRVAIDDFGGT